jgi:DNA invertase Pin-like site-specific DNA recombinase
MANVTVIPARTVRRQVHSEAEKPKLKVAAYCRVSTDTDEQATSYEAQVEHYTEYIKKNSEWELAGIYADDGISGTNTKKREEFNRMIEDCMEGKIDMIITKSISRFARNTLDCLQYIRKLKDKNIPVFFEKENINTMDAKGELLLTIMASLAQQESQSLSQNVKLGLQFRYQAGKVQVNHNRFLGYTKDDDGNLIVDEDEAVIIKRIYREYLEGASLQDICESLMADGILTGAGKEKWIPSTVHKILSNEKYIGDALLQKTVTTDFLEKKRVNNNGIAPQYYVEGSHEAIIPREIYMRVQEEMVRRANLRSGADGRKKRIYSSKYALSSICTCEKCGDIYRRIAWNNRGKKYTVWRCCTRVGGGPSACNAPTILEEDLQAAVVKAINMVLASRSTVIEDMKQVIDKVLISEIDEQIQSIDRKMSEISKEIVNRVSANLTYEDLADQMGDLREEKQKLLVEQAEDNGKQRMKEVLISFLNEQDVEIKEFDENLVRKLIEQVIIHEDGTLTVEFKSGTKVVVETKKETES